MQSRERSWFLGGRPRWHWCGGRARPASRSPRRLGGWFSGGLRRWLGGWFSGGMRRWLGGGPSGWGRSGFHCRVRCRRLDGCVCGNAKRRVQVWKVTNRGVKLVVITQSHVKKGQVIGRETLKRHVGWKDESGGVTRSEGTERSRIPDGFKNRIVVTETKIVVGWEYHIRSGKARDIREL